MAIHSTSVQPPPHRLTLNQDLTIYHAEALKDALLLTLGHGAAIELDLSQITEIDTAGIQLLILLKRESQQLGLQLDIVAHSAAVRELIEFYNLAAYFGDPLFIPAQSH